MVRRTENTRGGKVLRIIAVLLLGTGLAVSGRGTARTETLAPQKRIVVYFFWGENCPHCARAKPFVAWLEERYPGLEVRAFETRHDADNARLFSDLSKACGTRVFGVPTFFIGERVIVGFDETRVAPALVEAVEECIGFGCTDPAEKLGCDTPTYARLTEGDAVVDLPVVGRIDTRKLPLPLFTVVIGLLDGFNPCAMWVLTFLLTLIIYARSRKKILLIGSTFVAVSGIVYFLFMAAWLNIFLLVGYVDATRVVIALVAVTAGVINVKDFFWFKKGVSLTIPERYKPGLFKRMRELIKKQGTFAVLGGTAVLAGFANLIELFCTAGFPAIYTRILTLNRLSATTYYGYLALYNVVYVIPLAAIVGVFAYTMGGRKFSEREGRILKLVGGALMLILGTILLVKPDLIFFG